MQRPRLHRNDALLLLLAVLVVVGTVYTVKQGSRVPQADVSTAAPAETALPASPSATPVPTESATPTQPVRQQPLSAALYSSVRT